MQQVMCYIETHKFLDWIKVLKNQQTYGNFKNWRQIRSVAEMGSYSTISVNVDDMIQTLLKNLIL